MLGGVYRPYKDDSVQRILEEAFAAGLTEVDMTVCGVAYAVRHLRSAAPLQVQKQDPTRTRPVRRVSRR